MDPFVDDIIHVAAADPAAHYERIRLMKTSTGEVKWALRRTDGEGSLLLPLIFEDEAMLTTEIDRMKAACGREGITVVTDRRPPAPEPLSEAAAPLSETVPEGDAEDLAKGNPAAPQAVSTVIDEKDKEPARAVGKKS